MGFTWERGAPRKESQEFGGKAEQVAAIRDTLDVELQSFNEILKHEALTDEEKKHGADIASRGDAALKLLERAIESQSRSGDFFVSSDGDQGMKEATGLLEEIRWERHRLTESLEQKETR